ncbi:MAG TPA: cytidine deaminase [Sediminispirochaeta sp.]|nr:cytidine deaminase [Sediminispirochaeta sp.]
MTAHDPELNDLVQQARVARERAYAPYSKFKVGAALESSSGEVYTGCNVENASYGATICAERGAVMRAVAEGRKDFRRIVVVTDAEPPAQPCALCLQVLAEFCGADFEIISVNLQGGTEKTSLGALLPRPFNGIP